MEGATKAIAELYGVPVYHTPEKAKDLNEWKVIYHRGSKQCSGPLTLCL